MIGNNYKEEIKKMNLYRIVYTDTVKQFISLLDDEVRRLDETTFLNVMTFGIGNTYISNEYIIDMNFPKHHPKLSITIGIKYTMIILRKLLGKVN